MCENCGCNNNTELPIGPTGNDGADGINGINGTTVLYAYNNAVGSSTNNATEVSFGVAPIPPDTLSTNGDEIEIYSYMEYTASTTVTIRFKLAGLIIYTYTQSGSSNEKLTFRIKICRDSPGTQVWYIEKFGIAGSTVIYFHDLVTSVMDDSILNFLEVTAQGTSGSGMTALISKKLSVYRYKV